MIKRKIINDPVYGFITLDSPLVLEVVAHPYYQRLRRIHQMAMAHLVYPGAVHTRLHHSLGAYHLMGQALQELKRKGIDITPEEEVGAQIAILLHDVGHGPFSHALEGTLIPGISHEIMSLAIMRHMNQQWNGALDLAIDIFTGQYPKNFLHQLVSGQLDVDRMDYLSRDSYFTGVSEGVIGYDRIIKMLTVHNGELMVEEKAIYSIEKFLVARRLMYWQVYLHKTVMAAEQMLIRIVQRARLVGATCHDSLQYFLDASATPTINEDLIGRFCQLDDQDLVMAIKTWQNHPDKVLSLLCKGVLERRLLKLRMQSSPFDESLVVTKKEQLRKTMGLDDEALSYLVFTGIALNTTYSTQDERIQILFKNGEIKDISEVEYAIIQQSVAATVGKHYICWLEPQAT